MTNVPSRIPTFYKNIRFRSRLEARWGQHFSICSNGNGTMNRSILMGGSETAA
jgi:hypothetical protein